MADEREYEAGTELDDASKAFLARGQAEDDEPAPKKKSKAKAEIIEDDDSSTSVAADDAVETDDDDQPSEEEKAAAKAIEDRARLMGWVPPEEFRGDGGKKALTAQEFIDRANPAILNERIDKLARDRENDRKEHEKTVQRMERMNERALKKQAEEYKAHIEDLERRRDEHIAEVAATEGKEAAAETAERWRQHIAAQKPPEAEEPKEQEGGPDRAKLQQAASAAEVWIAKRPQYQTDARFQRRARALMDVIKDEMADKGFDEQFGELDRQLATLFPDYYRDARPNGVAGRQNGNGAAPPPGDRNMDGVRVSAKKATNYASRLPAAARTQGERLVKRGDFKDLEAYAKSFYEEDA